MYKGKALALGLIYGASTLVLFQKPGNAMAFQVGRVIAENGSKVAQGIAVGAAAIYETVRNDRSDNYMPPMMTPPISNDSNPLDNFREQKIENSVKSAITQVNRK